MSLDSLLATPTQEQEERGLVYTPREIAQQPQTWRRTFQIVRENLERLQSFLEEAGVRDVIVQRPVVWLIGAGTSDYIGQSLALLLREKWGCEVSSVASTDLLPNLEAYVVPGRRYLWISFSRSGDSPEGVAVLERAAQRYPEITHLVVSCNAAGAMASISRSAVHASVIVLDDAVNDRSLVMTSSYTNMILFGQCLAHLWSLNEYGEILEGMIAAGEDLLPRADELAQQSAKQSFPRVCFVGSGTLAGVAQEAALKVLEMTAGKVKSSHESVLGLRHGPMAALDRETLFVAFVSGDDSRAGYAYDLLDEITQKQIVGQRIVVGPAAAQPRFAAVCDTFLPIQTDCEDAYRPVLDILFGQLLGLYCSLDHGLKPDTPSAGGVINRVVAKFALY